MGTPLRENHRILTDQPYRDLISQAGSGFAKTPGNMSSPLPEDPYISLGVAKDATPQTIKTQYRKLVLKFHPDKVQDPALKQAAVDEFHKIQKAYEVVGDEDKRD